MEGCVEEDCAARTGRIEVVRCYKFGGVGVGAGVGVLVVVVLATAGLVVGFGDGLFIGIFE